MSEVEIRPVRPEEEAPVGALTADTYVAEGYASEAYAPLLRDVPTRAREATVLVAVHDGEVLGAVTVVTQGGPWANLASAGEAEVRMLVTAPAARGRGVGQALVQACLDAARADGCERVVLSSQPEMRAAHRIYGRLGFRRAPERDWSPEPGVDLQAYALDLAP